MAWALRTEHEFRTGGSAALADVAHESVHLAVTSPPYPMIEMWDDAFARQSDTVRRHLEAERGDEAFEAMHAVLDATWDAVARALVRGGFASVNVGDATRTIGGDFRLYPNHARIVSAFRARGFDMLPSVLWRKPTNAPNKFMGSGMLPAGAYVTLEHEHILVFRKRGRRAFATDEEKKRRARSAIFWEERNQWFSDLWELKGARQGLGGADRDRSAAFPIEVPWRLAHMFSLRGDTVLDPFLGTGTTSLAAGACARSSLGVEIEPSLGRAAEKRFAQEIVATRELTTQRLDTHLAFVQARASAGKPLAHRNPALRTPVVTRQERELELLVPVSVSVAGRGRWSIEHGRLAIQTALGGEAEAAPELPTP